MLDLCDDPAPNDASVRTHRRFGKLFGTEIPEVVEGFECKDAEQMKVSWPEGTDKAKEVSRGDSEEGGQ